MGLEKPTVFRGELHPGQKFEYPIGSGLSFRLDRLNPLLPLLLDSDWEIGIGPSGTGSREDFSACATGPFHGTNPKQVTAWHFQGGAQAKGGPGGVGQPCAKESQHRLLKSANAAFGRSKISLRVNSPQLKRNRDPVDRRHIRRPAALARGLQNATI